MRAHHSELITASRPLQADPCELEPLSWPGSAPLFVPWFVSLVRFACEGFMHGFFYKAPAPLTVVVSKLGGGLALALANGLVASLRYTTAFCASKVK